MDADINNTLTHTGGKTMKRTSYLSTLVAAGSLLLGVYGSSAQAFGPDGITTKVGSLQSQPAANMYTVYRVKCEQTTNIWAWIKDASYPAANTNNYHLTNTCIAPNGQKGKGDIEYAAPDLGYGTLLWAKASNCKEALVIVSGEVGNNPYSNIYQVTLACEVGKFASGFPIRIDNLNH